jgi:TPR repeat protein
MRSIYKYLLLSSLLLSEVKCGPFENSVALYKKGLYKEAFVGFEKLAKSGNANAQYNLGMMYYNGTGVKKNKIMAFVWLEQASNNGSKLAQNKLGYMYEKGEVKGTKDEAKAINEYLKSALQNYNFAQLNLAMKYSETPTKENLDLAFFWYQKAANNGNTAAMNNLANMYYHGQSVRKDYKKAFDLYFKAATLGDYIAQFNLAMMYYNGEYVKKSEKEALIWLTFSAESGYPNAQVRLGNFYREGTVVKQDYQLAFYWYFKAAEQNDPAGQYYVGYCYYYGLGVAKSLPKAKHWMEVSSVKKYDGAISFLKRNSF